MRIKLLQRGRFFIRLDLTFMDRFGVLLGFNYCEGTYIACTDMTKEHCYPFDYAEFQIGLLFVTIAFGKEQAIIIEDEQQHDQLHEDLPAGGTAGDS